MSIRLLKKFIKESLGREIFADPQMFADRDSAALVQKQLTKVKTIDKTKLPVKDILKELILAAGPETYIRFQNKYDDAVDAPPLEISPNIQYQTPHGIYGYPLDQDNLQNLIMTGKPTNAEYFVNYLFFHVYKINKSKSVNIEKSDDGKNIIQGRYTNKNKVVNDIAECIRLSTTLISQSKTIEASEQDYEDFEKDIQKIRSRKFGEGIDLKDFYKKYFHLIGIVNKKSQSLINIYKFEIAESIYIRLQKGISRQYSNVSVSKQFIFFSILKESVGYIATTISDINNTSRGQYFSLLLKAVGITGITDYATGTIHSLEPSQSVSFDFSGNTIEPIGTYRNIFKNISDNKDVRSKYEEEFNEILKSLEDKNLVSWSVKSNEDISSYDFKNLSLKSFKTVVNYIGTNEVKLFDFISNTAEKNKHTNVVDYIYENFKDFKSPSRISVINFLLKNKTAKINETHMKNLYKEFIKSKLNILDKEGVRLDFASEFVASPSLPRSVMFDIIKNTSDKGWQMHGRFRQDPIIESLSTSNILDKDICDLMIKKFSIEKLSFLKTNNTAPITKHIVKQIENLLNGEDIKQKNDEDILKILELIALSFDNKHISKDEFLYLCNLCSPIFKNYYGNDFKKQNIANNFMMQMYIESAIKSLIYNNHFNRQVLENMNITLKEEINILHQIIEDSWTAEYSFDSGEFSHEESSSPSAKKFDLIQDGIPYLEQHPKGEELKHKLSRAYSFITAKQKI